MLRIHREMLQTPARQPLRIIKVMSTKRVRPLHAGLLLRVRRPVRVHLRQYADKHIRDRPYEPQRRVPRQRHPHITITTRTRRRRNPRWSATTPMRDARDLLPPLRLHLPSRNRRLIDLGDGGSDDNENMRPIPPVVLDAAEPVQRAVVGVGVAVRVDKLAEQDIVEEGGGEDGGHGGVVGEGGEADCGKWWRRP